MDRHVAPSEADDDDDDDDDDDNDDNDNDGSLWQFMISYRC